MKKRFFAMLLCFMMAFTMSACTGSDDIGDNVDQAFVEHVQKGLEERWSKQPMEKLLSTSINNVDDFSELHDYLKIEYEAVEVFKEKEFKDTVLKELAEQYLHSLEIMMDATGTDWMKLTSEIFTDYNDAATERNIVLYRLHESYNLNIAETYQEVFTRLVKMGQISYEKKEKDHIKSGVYEVGKDLPAGEYIAFQDSDDSVASLELRKTEYKTGSEDEIISYHFFNNVYITVKEGQFIEFESCNLYPVEDAPTINETDAKERSIMLKVGKDIAPGNYIIYSNENSALSYSFFQVTILRDIDNYQKIVMNGSGFQGEQKVQLQEGQYLELEWCSIKTAD